jgi:glycosyltransferase involved in cell wall biosynthesis
MITVITPTHHRPDTLYRCIKAIQRSTFQDYEHIVIADRCQYAKPVVDYINDPRITYLETPFDRPENVGSVGKNIGIAAANNDFICYCDDDNVLTEIALEAFIKGLKTGADYTIGVRASIRLGWGDNSIKAIIDKPFLRYDIPELILPLDRDDMICYAHTKDCVTSVGGWKSVPEVGHNEDGELIWRLHRAYKKYSIINDVVCIYYSHHGCDQPDNAYKELLANKNPDDLFVYPELTTNI